MTILFSPLSSNHKWLTKREPSLFLELPGDVLTHVWPLLYKPAIVVLRVWEHHTKNTRPTLSLTC